MGVCSRQKEGDDHAHTWEHHLLPLRIHLEATGGPARELSQSQGLRLPLLRPATSEAQEVVPGGRKAGRKGGRDGSS